MNKLKSLLALSAASSLLAACSQGQSAPPVVTQVNPATIGKLQFAVGYATFAGNAHGLNIVSTFRQANGLSAVLVDTPTIGGPSGPPVSFASVLPPAVPDGGDGIDPYATIQDGGPSMQDYGTGVLSGTPQTVHLGAPICDTAAQCPGSTPNTTTFGQSGGVFGMGIQPANYTTSSTPYTIVPYTQPIFGPAADAFTDWGGPPAFDDPKDKDGMGTRDGLHNLGAHELGWNMGITAVALKSTPPAGTYTMGVSVPTGQNQSGQSGFATYTASQSIKAGSAPLGTITAPTFVPDGSGGGSFAIAPPAGVTEGYVLVIDYGPGGAPGAATPNCQGTLGPASGFPDYYTVAFHGGAPQTVTLTDTNGPNLTIAGPTALTPSPTICTAAQNSKALGASSTGDTYQVVWIATDYPLYEASYPMNTQQTPAIMGANDQDDITISAPSGLATST